MLLQRCKEASGNQTIYFDPYWFSSDLELGVGLRHGYDQLSLRSRVLSNFTGLVLDAAHALFSIFPNDGTLLQARVCSIISALLNRRFSTHNYWKESEPHLNKLFLFAVQLASKRQQVALLHVLRNLHVAQLEISAAFMNANQDEMISSYQVVYKQGRIHDTVAPSGLKN